MIEFQTRPRVSSVDITIKGSDCSSHYPYYFSKPFMFVNIRKNASTSIYKLLDEIRENSNHDHNADKFWFTIVRDPMERFYSAMNYLNQFTVDHLGHCLREYPKNTSEYFMDEIIHFTPQRLFTEWFESRVDLKFYSIKNLKPLCKEIQDRLSTEIEIPHKNSRDLTPARSMDIEKWINENKDFVTKFLKDDYEWYKSLKIES